MWDKETACESDVIMWFLFYSKGHFTYIMKLTTSVIWEVKPRISTG